MKISQLPKALVCAILFIVAGSSTKAQINFSSSGLAGESLNNPTSLQFGPDDRLYVSQQNGNIYAYDVVRNGPNDYQVTSTELIGLVKGIPNHNSDGSLNTNVNNRQVTGILVTGTAANPILYVSSSDPRIGGGGGSVNTNLDENSGVLSRLTWTGAAWDMVHLVRGLPRSEENHAVNGMALSTSGTTLYLTAGGHTNKGAPSNNFTFLPEFAYSAAILTVDLTAIDAMPTLTDAQGQKYKYDLPTLDDEDKPNVANPTSGFEDVGDPWGGNGGKNQAELVLGGPVQVYSSGWRNHYDVVMTQNGRLYTFDNGPNSGWGGIPINCSNATNEANSQTQPDNLHYVSGPGYYGGHPNPTRANRNNTFNASNPQSPVPIGMEDPFCDYRNPGSADGALATINSSTNGICEYTASNFGGVLQGNLLAAAFNGNIYRFELNAAGNMVITQSSLASGFGATPLDVIAQGDLDPFPGTVWACTYGADNITIFEPQDFQVCSGTDSSFTVDSDNDGYSNGDELLNGTDQCNASNIPNDFDMDFLSDLIDPDDDNDGINDTLDLFARDFDNGTATNLPISYQFDNSVDPGINGWGFTGTMVDYVNDYMDLYDDGRMTVGGAALKFTIDSVEAGDALGALNNQRYAFQFGVNTSQSIVPFTVEARVMGPFATVTAANDMSQGVYVGSGDQDNYLKMVVHANGGNGGIEIVSEVGGVVVSSNLYPVPGVIGAGSVELFLSIDPNTLQVQPRYSFSQGAVTDLGPAIPIQQSWLSNVLAVGFTATSRNAPIGFAATWDYVNVTRDPNTSLGQWYDVAYNSPPPTQRHENSFVQVGDKFYLIGGRGNKPVQIFDITDSTWSTGATPPQEIHHFQAVEYEGMIWCVGAMTGGFPNETPIPNIYIYDPISDSWHVGPTIPAARRRGSSGVVVYNNEIYVVSGIINGHLSGWVTWLDKFNPQTNTWTVLPDAPRARDHWQAQLADGKIYAIGGRRSGANGTFNATVAEVDIYDIVANTWSTLPVAQNLPTLRAAGVIGRIGDEIIFAGGESGTQSAAHEETEALDIHSHTWRSVNTMLDSRHGTSAISNNGGLWVCAGSGNRGGGPELNTMETFFFFGKRQPVGSATVQGTFAATPPSHNYGQVVFGDSATQSFTLTNSNGNQGVVITGLNYTGDPDFSDNFPLTLPVVLPAGASLSFDIKYIPGALGARSGALEIATTQTGSPLTIPLNGDGINLTPLYRVNAGGPAYTTIGGDPFSADAFSTGGNTSSTGNAIAGTVDDVLYQTERWGNFTYNFPITNPGLYEVRLHFAEIWSGGQSSGTRVFSMALEGTNVLTNYDIFADVGGYTATVKTFQVAVTDGSLDLTVLASANNPKISAIEVLSAGSIPAANLVATPDPLHFFSQQIATTSPPQDLTIRNSGVTSVNVTGITISGTNASEFGLTFSAPVTILGGDSIQVPFTFSPTTVGLKTATATIAHSGANSPLSVALTGEAINSTFNVSATVVQQPTCAGASDGSATTTTNNGTSPFSYLWTPGGQTAATATGLAEGTYTVRVIDATNDTAYANVILVADTLMASTDACRDQVSSLSDAWVIPTGGTAPYTYLWDFNAGNSTNDTVFGLNNGSYSVMVTDANSCTTIATVVIDAATPVCDTCALPNGWANQDIGAVAAAGDVCYDSQTMEFTVEGSGSDIWGTADEFQYVYQSLTGDGEIIARVTAIQNTHQWSKAGVMMRGSLAANSEEVMMLKRGAAGWSWQYRASAGSTTGFSGNTSSVTPFPLWVRVVRAGNTFTGYYSGDGVTWTQQGAAQTINMPSTLFVGLAVTSHNDGVINTSVFDNVQVISASTLMASATVSSNFNGADVSCFGASDGSATVTVTGGIPPFTYQWDANAANQTTATATGLSAGTYSVTVTDGNTATATATVTLTEPALLSSTAAVSSPITCSGDVDGAVSVTASGGTAPYTYAWGANAGNATTATVNGLGAGTYNVAVTDANGCVSNASVILVDPAPITVAITPSLYNCGLNVSCNGATDGSVTASASGGTAPYAYNWGSSFALRINAGGPTFTAQNNDVYLADQYFLTPSSTYTNNSIPDILNTNDDVLYRTERYNANLSYQVPVPNGTYNVILHFAEIYVGATGGNTNLGVGARVFSTTLEGQAMLTNYDLFADVGAEFATQKTALVTVTDDTLNIDMTASVNNAKLSAVEILSVGGSNPSLNGLSAGTYNVTVTDANGCSATQSVTLNEPALLTASTTVTNVTCGGQSDGSATVAVSGGCTPYTYAWDANTGSQVTATASGLPGGTYSVTITDANGCTATASATITEPAAVTANVAVVSPIACAGDANGSVSVTAGGGTAPFTYAWSANTGNATTATVSGLGAGTYSVTVTDVNGCMASDSVALTEPTAVAVNLTPTTFNCGFNVSCNGAADGSVTANASGGTPPYSYNWGSSFILRLNAGGPTYTAQNNDVYQADQYFLTPSSTYSNNTIPNILNTNDDVLYRTERYNANLAYQIPVPNGTYNVILHFAEIYVGAQGGNVNLGVGDRIFSTTLEGQPMLTNYDLFADVGAGFATQKSAIVTVTDGTLNIDFSATVDNAKLSALEVLSVGGTNPSLNGLTAGTYSVIVTDANGCTANQSVTLTEPAILSASTSVTNVSCGGQADGVTTATPAGGCAPYTYTWDAGTGNQTTAAATGLSGGSYTVTITDDNGCTTTATATITEPAAVTASAAVTSPLACAGDANGEATVTAAGGTAPYTYLWDAGANNATTAVVSGLSAGTYSVTVTDANNCTATASVTLTEPAPVTVNITPSTFNCGYNISCNGASDGSVTANASGGTAPYSFNWGNSFALRINVGGPAYTAQNSNVFQADQYFLTPSNTYTNNNIPDILNTNDDALYRTERWNSNLRYRIPVPNGTYNVILHFAEIYIGVPGGGSSLGAGDRVFSATLEGQPLLTNYDLFADVGPATATQKSAVITVTDDTLNIDFLASVNNAKLSGIEVVSVGGANASLNGLTAGTYNVIVTDANGCQATQSIVLTEPAPLAGTTTVTNVSCAGQGDGSIATAVTGGCAPYTYAWSNSQTTASASNLGAGSYTVTITDANGCTTTASATVAEPAAISVSASVSSAISIPGASDGAATATVTGGTPAYSYLWSNNQTTATATGLNAGTYSVTVTDANGCTATDTVLLLDPVSPIVLTTSTVNVSCNGGSDGQATVSPTGGLPPYTYAWSNGQTTATATGLIAGNYSVTVTDANTFGATAQVTITEPTALGLTAQLSTYNCGYNVSCAGAADGSITATVNGGTTPYNYVWNNAPGVRINCGGPAYTSGIGTTFAADQFFGSPSNTYTNNNIPDILGTDDDALYRTERFHPNLNYSIPVANGDHVVILHFAELYFGATGGGPGGPNRRVFDVNLEGQLVLDDLDINQVAGPETAIVRTFVTNVSDGILNVDFSSSINNAKLSAIEVIPVATGAPSLNNLFAGTYSLTVVDGNGCAISDSYTLTAPDAIVANATASDVSCNGLTDGSASVSATGGCAPYTFAWSNSQSTANATNLAAGTYSVTITDDNGCTTTTSVVVSEPALLSANATVDNNVSCNGAADGQVTASATGGTAPYTFAWSNSQTTATASNLAAGTYTVTITDANNCTAFANVTLAQPAAIVVSTVIDSTITCANLATGQATASATSGTAPYSYSWSNGQTTATATGLIAGTYTVTVTDANNCNAVGTVTLTQPNPIQTTASVIQNVSCGGGNDGQATVVATGGTAGYTYLWSNGFTTATNLAMTAGVHYVTVTDANNCTAVDSVTLTEPPVLTANYVINSQVTCYAYTDGSVTASGQGGTPPYSYQWSVNAGSQTTATAQNLMAGNYAVTVTDANNCTAVANVTVTQPGVLLLAFTVNSHVSCFGGNNGEASALVFGGTPPYSYLWDANANNQTGATASGLTAGTFNLTVTDANGCTVTGSVGVNQPAQMVSTATINNNVSCFGFTDGSATITTTGGTPGYAYSWPASAGGQLSASVNNLPAGTFVVQVRDSRFCADSVTVVITEPAQIVASATADNNVSCNGLTDGQATVTATGGTTPYSYLWSNSQTTTTATGLGAGVYTVTVTDANNCVTVDAVSITEPAVLTASAVVDNHVACNSTGGGQATVTGTGGTQPYTYAWSDNQSTATATNLNAGTYSVTITDANNCTATDTVTITAPAALNVSAAVDNHVSCNGSADGQATATVSGGTLPYSYLWSNGQTTATATGLNAGTHTVTITDGNSCTGTATVTITEPANMVANATVDMQPSCGVGNDGQASVAVNGGTAPYSYLWSNSQTTAIASNLAGGNYTVTVTDANSCTATASVSLTVTGVISLSLNGQDVSCNGAADGQATASPGGGIAPYSYLWSNGQTTATAINLTGGTYSVTVMDNNGCDAVDSISINEPAAITLTANDVSCNGDTDGSILASGGTGPYTYSVASVTSLSADFQVRFGRDDAEEDQNGIVRRGGNDLELVFDGNNKGNQKIGMIYRGVNVPQGAVITNAYIQFTAKNTGNRNPSVLTITGQDVNNAPLITTTSNDITNRTRTSASASWTPPNWTTPFQAGPAERTVDISAVVQEIVNRPGWNPGNRMCLIVEGQGRRRAMSFNGNNSQAPVLHVEWAQSASFTNTNLSPGTYNVMVTDANGCTLTQSMTVGEPALLVAAAVVDSQATCNGGNDGQASASATGGTAPYTYAWSNNQTSATVNNLGAGTYTVSVTDANNCTATASVVITQTSPNFTFNVSDVSCNGGNDGCIVVGGGVPPFTYVLDGTPLTAQTGFIFSRVNAGSDDVEETVSSGGISLGSPSLELAEDNFAGSGDFQLVGMRFNNLNIPQGATITAATLRFRSRSNSNANTNLLIVGEDVDNAATFSNTNGNVSSRTATSASVAWNNVPTWANNQFYNAPDLSTIVEEIVNRPGWTPGNSLALIVSGNAGHRNADAYEAGIFQAPLLTIQYSLQPTLCNLAAGTYVLDVTDSTGCMVTQTFTINEPPALALTGTDASCSGVADGSISASGGTAPYSYQLSGTGSGSITAQVNGSQDDAEETVNSGAMNTGSGSLEMGEDNFANSNDPHLVGMRFENIAVPQGATITNAYVEFTAGPNTTDPTNLLFVAEDVDDAVPFTNSNSNISNRPTTTASVNWNNVPAFSANQVYASPALNSLVQEVVNRNGWQSGNALAVIVSGTGHRDAKSYNNNPAQAPRLVVEYTTATVGQSVTNLYAGGYQVTVTDANGCTLTDSVTLINAGTNCNPCVNGRVQTGLLALYPFYETSGNVVHDLGGFGTPLDLTIANPGNTSWLSGNGLSINSSTIIEATTPATKIATACAATNEITVEAWVTAANTSQGGPSRMVTFSQNTGARNWTLGQQGSTFIGRVRTTNSSLNGTPDLPTGNGVVNNNALQHVVMTRDAAGAWTLYVDGVVEASGTRTGNFSNWDPNYPFALANEATLNRTWLGDMFLVAVYERALTPAEIGQNLLAGPDCSGNFPPFANCTSEVQLCANPLEVSFDGSGSFDPDGSITSYAWDFGDGNSSSNATSLHTYAAAGTYNVSLIVTDNNGFMDTCSSVVTVSNQAVGRVDSGLVAFYPFIEGSGATVHDASGYLTPLNLQIADSTAITWLPGNGISINAPTILRSAAPASKIQGACTATNEITVEAWVKPANTTQGGPSRIASMSVDPYNRNFTLAQQGQEYRSRIRTSTGNANGTPDLATGNDVTTGLQHVVFTRNTAGAWLVYVDGVVVATGTRTGNLSTWDATWNFMLANEETENRAWLGEMHMVAVYNVALNSTQINQNLNAGSGCVNQLPPFAVLGSDADACATTLNVNFDGSQSVDLDGNIVSYAWDFGDGNTGTGAMPSHTYASAGTYTVTLTVTDNDNLSTTATDTVVVNLGGRVSSGLIALYPFFEGSGTIVHDASGYMSPLDLVIPDPNAVSWLPGNALSINAPTILKSAMATKVHSACSATNEITVEAWVKPANTTQGGPSRIASMSADPYNRNFTLAQQGQQYRSRIRTSTSAQNGTPDLSTGGVLNTSLQHVVFTRDAAGAWIIYVDGQVEASGTRTGNFSTWNDTWTFMLANELTENRAWLGEMHLVALYDVALTATEINQNLAAGPGCTSQLPPFAVFKSQFDACASALQVYFDGSLSSDADGNIVSYAWDFGDGNTATGLFPTHTYASAGTYTVTLTVTDNDNLSTTSSETITLTTGGRIGSGLIAYYPFTEGSGNTVADQSGFGTPLDLTVANPGNVSWLPGNGMKVSAATILQPAGNGGKISQACGQTNEITVEAWVRPDNLTQGGPARIVTLSNNTSVRNFTLGQQGNEYRGRLRTTSTGNNGTPDLASGSLASVNNVQHVVMTRDASGNFVLYVDGVVAASGTRGGTFNNWNNTYGFALVNELTNNRAWLGQLYQVAIYDNALSAAQVQQNYSAGPNCTSIGSSKSSAGNEALGNSLAEAPLVEAFPNPFKDVFTLHFESKARFGQLNVKVYDQYGQEIQEHNFLPDDGRFLETEIPLRDVTKGVYILVVRSGDFSKRIRIIKQ